MANQKSPAALIDFVVGEPSVFHTWLSGHFRLQSLRSWLNSSLGSWGCYPKLEQRRPWHSWHEVYLDGCSHPLDVADTYILIGHIPVRSLSKWHYFPHDNPVAPDIAGWRKLAVGDGLWSCPSNRYLPSLEEDETKPSQFVKVKRNRHASYSTPYPVLPQPVN